MDVTREVGGKFIINDKTFAIYGGINTVGRNKEATVNIKSLNISQHHAIFILVDDDLHFISDLKSSNGTFLNGEQLVALQLYRLKNGSRVKFADIEGIYSQCTSEHSKFKSNISQCTQNYTQSFYGTDTQIIDESCLINHNDKTVCIQNSSYVPTQVLLNVATALETSYEKLHEQPTQLIINTENVNEMPTQMVKFQKIERNPSELVKNKTNIPVNLESESISELVETTVCGIDQSIIDLHEAETQKVSLDVKYEIVKTLETPTSESENVLDNHELETQLIPLEEKESRFHKIPENDLNESLRDQNITKNYVKHQDIHEEQSVSNSSNVSSKSANEIMLNYNSVAENLNTDIPKSPHSIDENSSDTGSDIIRPVKKSMVIFDSTQESLVHDHEDNGEKQEGSNDSFDFMTMQKIVDIEKKHLKKDSVASNDSSEKLNMLSNEGKEKVNEHYPEETCSQDSDSVHPLGISRNIIVSQNSTDGNCSDTDSDIIRPVKKSLAVLDSSQESFVDEYDNNAEIQHEDSNDSLDFMTMQKVTDIEKKHLEKNSVASSDLLDTLNILASDVKDKVIESPCNVNKNKEENEGHSAACDAFISERKSSATVHDTSKKSLDEKSKVSDSETDIECDFIKQNSSQDGGSDTDNEKLMINEVPTINELKNQKYISSDNEPNTATEKGKSKFSVYKNKKLVQISDSESKNKREIKKKVSLSGKQKNKMNLRRKKRNNVMSDSETDSDIDTDTTDINLITSNKINRDEEKANGNEDIIFESEVMDQSNLNDDVGEEKLIDETKFERGILDYSVELTSAQSEKKGNIKKNILGINESLNDSDIIPATQEIVHVRSISQSSKFENSEESFRLGLTQLMEENVEETGTSHEKSSSQKENNLKKKDTILGNPDLIESGKVDCSDNSQEVRKKFVFKKKNSADTSERANITLDDDEEMYEAKTQSLCEKTVDRTSKINDDHIFVQPTQKLLKKKVSTEKTIPEEEIYMLCTQKLDGSTNKSENEDIYLQCTQKMTSDIYHNDLEETNKISLIGENNSPQCLVESNVNNTEMKGNTPERLNQDDDLNDMFATQTMLAKTTPKKSLERELEFMFATQRAVPTEESLDKIQDVIFRTPVDTSKLPEQDSDLEAILATQKTPDSPKTAKVAEKTETDQITLGKSIESQLEVLFHSQTNSLPPEKVSRPVNPLANLFGKDTQETEPILSEISNVETSQVENGESSFIVNNKSYEDASQCSILMNRKNAQNGVEQSFALLEAKSTRIRRSARNTNCEEVTVSCPKSRKSMMIAPNEKFEEVLEEVKPMPTKAKRGRPARKRQSSTSSDLNDENKEMKKGSVVEKKRKASESSNISEDNKCSNMSSSSSESTRTKRASKYLAKIYEHQDDDFEVEEASAKKLKSKLEQKNEISEKIFHARRSTRTNGKPAEGEGIFENSKEEAVSSSSTVIANSKTVTSNYAHRDKNNSGEETSTKKQEKSVIEDRQKKSIISDGSCSSLKDNQEGVSSRTTKRRTDIVVSTPSKTRRRASAIAPSTGQSVLENQDSPSRNKRKQKIKVVFTMMENPKLESVIRLLGGSVVDSVDTCTVLITPSVKRSMKLLSAVGLGKPICSVKWVEDSKKKNQFLDPWDYLLIDKEAETKWDFSLRTSLERSLLAKLFSGYTFQLLVTTALDVLKGAIECCGGKIVARTPKETNNFIVVASPNQKDKFKKLLKQHQNLKVVEPEAIFDGVLRQEIRFERHLLN